MGKSFSECSAGEIYKLGGSEGCLGGGFVEGFWDGIEERRERREIRRQRTDGGGQRSEVRSILFSFGQLTRSLQVTVQVSEG